MKGRQFLKKMETYLKYKSKIQIASTLDYICGPLVQNLSEYLCNKLEVDLTKEEFSEQFKAAIVTETLGNYYKYLIELDVRGDSIQTHKNYTNALKNAHRAILDSKYLVRIYDTMMLEKDDFQQLMYAV